MSIILGIIGFLLIAGTIALKVFPATRRFINKGLLIGLPLIGLCMMASTGAFFYAEPGYQYMVQYPTGQQVSVMRPGYNLKLWGNVLPFKKIIAVRLTEEVEENSDTATATDNSVPVLFNDGVRANISTATIFRLPTDKETFVGLARDYRTEQNLINSSLIPITREVIRNSARELPAQRYISGGGGILESNINDQMEHGIVLLDVNERTELREEEPIGEPSNGEARTIKNRKVIVTEVVRRKDANGQFIRKPHAIVQYKIKITQSTVEKVNFEKKFKQMIEQQRDAAAKANVEKQLAKQAEYAQKRIVAEGEKGKAAKRAEMERQQVETLITAETQKKAEQFKKEQAEIALARAEIEAKNVKVRAQADADARKLKMVADGALEQKLDAWVKAQQAWAQAAGNHPLVPATVVGSSGSNTSANQFIDVMMANQARQLGVDFTPAKR